jgi:diaminopimelate decarboxylase
MQKGEWIMYRNFGAYGHVVATNFNGYEVPEITYLN